ncbi:copper amine oxidase N-terminal domain-containing protein [Paenibacillus kandeliae]|uniref:copper amine oxidase N-terminal domain-containing protein n=1 Tax=Paenibacillus kandeliae TaxID=3231269 RepID=UPI00345AF295
MNMKQLAMTTLASLILTGVIGTVAPVASAATSSVEVLLNARKMSFPDAKPFQDENSAVMVPIRFVSEKLGAKVGWSNVAGKQTVTLKTDDHSVVMTVGSATAVVDGQSKQYDSKIILKQSRTFVPLRLVSEGLGQPVNWDQVGKWVWIGSREVPTLEELNLNTKPISFVKKYFDQRSDSTFLNNISNKPYINVLMPKLNDLPIKMNGIILYDIEPIEINGENYLKLRTDSKNIGVDLLTKNQDFRKRTERDKLKEKSSDNSVNHYFNLVSFTDELIFKIKDKKPIDVTDIDYVLYEYASKDSMVLLSNPWRE